MCFCLRQAIRVSVNPLYFMIPATVGCSYAFMLPVSTPPNSIAFASGHLMVKDMVRNGRAGALHRRRLSPPHLSISGSSGKNRRGHERPRHPLRVAGHQHVGRRHV